jgi:hypothetical protein
MGLFGKAQTEPRHDGPNRFAARYLENRPPWMHNGTQVTLLDRASSVQLEVVGESAYQDNLWRLAGPHRPTDHVRVDICALPLAEDGNPYDANAVSVWISGWRVGYLSRADAQRLRPGLLALHDRYGHPIGLPGVIAGGGMRDDGPGRLGVFLDYDPADFGLHRQPIPAPPHTSMRTGLSAAAATDEADDSYDLSWMRNLPHDDAHAIPALRKLLASETDVLDRHFMFAQLEQALYRYRDAFASVLDEYDAACRQHDAEMDGIRAAFMAKFGKVPLLELYRQMAIRQQKLHDYGRALWWAERGLAVYGSDAARPEAVDDLRQRAAGYKAKLDRPDGQLAN